MSEASAPPRSKRKKKRWGRKLRNWFVGLVGPLLLRLWIRSLRLRGTEGMSSFKRCVNVPAGGIYVFWHQRLLVLTGACKSSGFRVLVSQHGDGEMVSKVLEGLGMKPVRGSSTRGGARACLEILREVDPGMRIAITPDGPKGPPHVFQDGAIYLASRTGLPIYPITVAARHPWRLPTWDGFMVPRPFSRTLIHLGEPFHVPRDAARDAIERLRLEAERRLRELTDRTDRELDELYAGANPL